MTASMRRTAIIPLLALLSTAGIGAAQAAQPSTPRPQLTADPLAVQAGTTVRLQGRGFPRNVHIALLAGPPHGEATRIGGASTGRRGRFTATIHIRPQSSPAAFVALACFDACRVKATAQFRIVAP
jgi:hypothetical protein